MSDIFRPSVIDIGSNSVRLVIYESALRATSTFYNEKISCKLGKLTKDGTLNKEARQSTLETLKRFKQICKGVNATLIQVIATAALRDAKDGKDFVAYLEKETALKITILSGEEEAMKAAKGVLYDIPDADGIVADLGGGSLELVKAQHNMITEGLSLPLGMLRLQNDISEEFDLSKYKNHISDVFQQNIAHDYINGAKNLYCVGGSWRALGSYYMYDIDYRPHIIQGFKVSSVRLLAFLEHFLTVQPNLSGVKLTGISKRRLLSMPYSALLLQELLLKGQFHHVVFTLGGIREGALYEYLSLEEQQQDPAMRFAQNENKRSARHIALASLLFEAMKRLFTDAEADILNLVEIFCYLSDIAWRHHPHQRAEYIFGHIIYSEIPNLEHNERLFLAYACASRYQADFKIDDKMIFYSGITPKMLYFAKIAGLAARYLYTVTGMSSDIMAHIWLEKQGDKVTLHPEAPDLAAGHNTNKRYDILSKYISKNYPI
ncbi:MAG: Ppx/GppA phosphatase family protein [Pseudomonadota bacterium]